MKNATVFESASTSLSTNNLRTIKQSKNWSRRIIKNTAILMRKLVSVLLYYKRIMDSWQCNIHIVKHMETIFVACKNCPHHHDCWLFKLLTEYRLENIVFDIRRRKIAIHSLHNSTVFDNNCLINVPLKY
jgi:hypothetical protein